MCRAPPIQSRDSGRQAEGVRPTCYLACLIEDYLAQIDFECEKGWRNAKAGREEQDMAGEAMNRLLRCREVERHLEGVTTILDFGAGTEAFSIPLAEPGYAVTHLDFAPAMPSEARQKAEGIPNILFVEANAADLELADRSIVLVLNMDQDIS